MIEDLFNARCMISKYLISNACYQDVYDNRLDRNWIMCVIEKNASNRKQNWEMRAISSVESKRLRCTMEISKTFDKLDCYTVG